MNTWYMIYQVERTKSAAEQREIDRSNAQLAASISRLWRALAGLVTAPRVSASPPHAIASDVSAGTPGHAMTGN